MLTKAYCEHVMTADGGEELKAPTVPKNCDAFLRSRAREFGKSATSRDSLSELMSRALQYSEHYASECIFQRFRPCLTQRRPRVSSFAPGFPTVAADGAPGAFGTFQHRHLPGGFVVGPH